MRQLKTADTVVITIQCSTENCPVESASDALDYLDAVLWTLPGVHGVEQVYSGPLDRQSVRSVKLFMDCDSEMQSPLAQKSLINLVEKRLREHELLKPCSIEGLNIVSKEDWAENWKQFWHVTHLSPHLVIRPTWEPYDAQPEDVVIDLDPGCAFGTGSHETTRLMLRAMEPMAQEKPFSERSILDLGCGSGILSIYSALLGCLDVMALDIEPEAIQMTRENAELNKVSHCIDVRDTPLIDMCRTRYDLILANIVAPVLIELMNDIALRIAPEGEILLSGLIDTSVDAVEQALESAGFSEIQRIQEGDWFLLKGRASK